MSGTAVYLPSVSVRRILADKRSIAAFQTENYASGDNYLDEF